MHVDPVAAIVGGLALLLVVAKLGGEVSTRLGQPSVLGELIVGILLGNLAFGGVALRELANDPTISAFAGIGALILLFVVGLESTVTQMLSVGLPSLLVATVGVVVPFALGWGVGSWLLPEAGSYVHAFIGATLCATSVGITARVLRDIGQSRGREAQIILGAAVIDDVLGLMMLGAVTAAVAAAAQGGGFSMASVAVTAGQALVFLTLALVIGVYAAPKLFLAASLLRGRGVLLTIGLSLCFALAWASSLIGLAPIVGAFAAGLVLEEITVKDFVSRGEKPLEVLLEPIADLFVPIFFVVMGMRTDVTTLLQPGVLGLAAALTVAAIVGKQFCALAAGPGVNRTAVGIGMVPRGEVGLIFANVGAGLTLNGAPIVSTSSFSAIVLMVVVTTLVTPPLLKWSFGRGKLQS